MLIGNPAAEALEDYLMDLRGYRVLPGALSAEEVRELTDWLDQHGSDSEKTLPPVGTWIGDVELHSYYTAPDGSNSSGVDDGMNFQHVYEAGEPWERLLDHPSWYPLVKKYLGNGTPFVHELFANVRGPGGFIGIHSGGWTSAGQRLGTPGTDGHIKVRPGEMDHPERFPSAAAAAAAAGVVQTAPEWAFTYLSIIVALTDTGPGDGATTLVPGSHKSLFLHPRVHSPQSGEGNMRVDGATLEGAMEVHLKAGDAVVFNDHLLHGSAARTNLGDRKMIVFRYLPQEQSTNRFGYEPSKALMQRLTPIRQQMLLDPNHPDPQPWERRGRYSPRSAVNLTGQYGRGDDIPKPNKATEEDTEDSAASNSLGSLKFIASKL